MRGQPFEVLRAVEQHDITFLVHLRDKAFHVSAIMRKLPICIDDFVYRTATAPKLGEHNAIDSRHTTWAQGRSYHSTRNIFTLDQPP